MFERYIARPTETTHAIHVTPDNYQQVADWIDTHVADDKGVLITHPGGDDRPGLRFFPLYAQRAVTVPIPGILQRGMDRHGRDYYQADSVGMFYDQWQPAGE